ncbi:MAG: trypsin-like peptidase domain-containing protein [Desulfosporosinus sp.]|nr:trypsin-like peptidase domain-containing protein [Desulfosporosinus sp.]
MTTILATGLVGALMGGFISAGVVMSVYTQKTQTKPTVPIVLGQQIPQAIKVGYNPSSSYPVVDIAKNVGPAVVTISNFQSEANQGFVFGDGGISNDPNSLIEVASGSGFIIDADNGYIVTNNHVIQGAQKLSVSLADGSNFDAQVIGSDARTDLAVIKINSTSKLTAVVLGDSATLQVGEPVVAIGNPGGEEFAGSVTAGVVSATNRIIDLQGESSFNLIQTDAAINPGNSGGPLVDYLGQVVGINSAKFQQSGFEGMGFAIPITDALPTIQQLIQNGYASHAGLNVQIAGQYTKEYAAQNGLPAGAYIAKIVAGGPADKAGLKQGDIITKVNDTVISDSLGLTHELFKYSSGDAIKITYYRDGSSQDVTVTLAEIKS